MSTQPRYSMMVAEEEPTAGYQAAQVAEFRRYRCSRRKVSARNGVGRVKERSNVEKSDINH